MSRISERVFLGVICFDARVCDAKILIWASNSGLKSQVETVSQDLFICTTYRG